MGFYAFFLAGSNYFAPVICGFIAVDQGWKWVFYWPSIFMAFALVWCFFFLEETNYVRSSVGIVETSSGSQTPMTPAETDQEKTKPVSEPEVQEVALGTMKSHSKKTYFQRLSIWQTSPGQSFFVRSWMSLYYLTWPVIFYAG